MSDDGYENYILEHWRMVRMLKAKDKDLWRVHFPTNGTVELLFIGLHGDKSSIDKLRSADELPEWVQHRIAALDVFGDNYPTNYVEGVGRRINRSTYYVEE
jgi:hypothetical protein